MAACPTCGRPMAPKHTAPSDDEIILGIEAHPTGMIYAAGRPNGSADRSQWYVTYGYPKGPISLGQVQRLVASGRLVPYLPGTDEGYTTPHQARIWAEKLAAHDWNRARHPLPANRGPA